MIKTTPESEAAMELKNTMSESAYEKLNRYLKENQLEERITILPVHGEQKIRVKGFLVYLELTDRGTRMKFCTSKLFTEITDMAIILKELRMTVIKNFNL